jgi:hypothetical protein
MAAGTTVRTGFEQVMVKVWLKSGI